MGLCKEPSFNKCGRSISYLLKVTVIICEECKRFMHLKIEGFPSSSQNQGVNKSKYFCRKVKVPGSEMERKNMEAPALQCNKIYCRGQTKAKEFMVSPAQIFLGWKLWCYFFTLSTSWWQKISCKPSVYQKKPSPYHYPEKKREFIYLSIAALVRSLPQYLPMVGLVLSGGGQLLSIP